MKIASEKPRSRSRWLRVFLGFPKVRSWLVLAIVFAPMVVRALDEVDRLQMKAQQAFWEKDYDAAIRFWSDAIKLSPNEAWIHINRARVYEAEKDTDRQLADYAEALRIDPSNAEILRLRARIYQDRHDTPAAMADEAAWVRLQIAAEKDSKAAARVLAQKAIADRNYELASACWSAILKIDPDDPEAWFQRALLDEILGQSGEALADVHEALRLDPQHAGAGQLRAQIDSGWKWEARWANTQDSGTPPEGKIFEAKVRQYGQVIATQGITIWLDGVDPVERAEAYGERGWNYLALGQPEKAVPDYTEALLLDRGAEGRDGDYEFRGWAYLRMGNHDRAIADFNAAQKESSREMKKDARENGGDAPTEESIAEMAGPITVHLAEAYMRAGRYPEAIDLLKKEMAVDPGNNWAGNALAWLHATCPDPKYRDGATALALAEKWGDGDTAAAAYAELGRWDDAVKAAQDAVKHEANDDQIPAYTARLNLYLQKKTCREIKELPTGED